MPTVRYELKFTDKERALVARRAKAAGMSEADLLRVEVVMGAMLDGDKEAFGIAFERIKEKVHARMRAILEKVDKEVPR